MRLHLVDINPEVAAALSEAFRPHPEVQVACDDILRVARHCVVSPANSQGFMDGGVDAAYLSFFGLALQAKVLDAIARRPEGFFAGGGLRRGGDRAWPHPISYRRSHDGDAGGSSRLTCRTCFACGAAGGA